MTFRASHPSSEQFTRGEPGLFVPGSPKRKLFFPSLRLNQGSLAAMLVLLWGPVFVHPHHRAQLWCSKVRGIDADGFQCPCLRSYFKCLTLVAATFDGEGLKPGSNGHFICNHVDLTTAV